MAIILTAAIVGRPAISLRNVALSAIIILVMSPSAVLGPGFQMVLCCDAGADCGLCDLASAAGRAAQRRHCRVFYGLYRSCGNSPSAFFVTSLIVDFRRLCFR